MFSFPDHLNILIVLLLLTIVVIFCLRKKQRKAQRSTKGAGFGPGVTHEMHSSSHLWNFISSRNTGDYQPCLIEFFCKLLIA